MAAMEEKVASANYQHPNAQRKTEQPRYVNTMAQFSPPVDVVELVLEHKI